MKKVTLAFGFIVLCFIARSQTPFYYYYGGEKQYLEVSPNKILVQFAENMDSNTIRSIIAKNTSFHVSDIRKADNKDLHLISFVGTDTTNTNLLYNTLN